MTPLNSEIQALRGHATADFFLSTLSRHSDSGTGRAFAPCAGEEKPRRRARISRIFRPPAAPPSEGAHHRLRPPSTAMTNLVPN